MASGADWLSLPKEIVLVFSNLVHQQKKLNDVIHGKLTAIKLAHDHEMIKIIIPVNAFKTLQLSYDDTEYDWYLRHHEVCGAVETYCEVHEPEYTTCCIDVEQAECSLRLLIGKIIRHDTYTWHTVSPIAWDLLSSTQQKARNERRTGLMQLIAYGAQDVWLSENA